MAKMNKEQFYENEIFWCQNLFWISKLSSSVKVVADEDACWKSSGISNSVALVSYGEACAPWASGVSIALSLGECLACVVNENLEAKWCNRSNWPFSVSVKDVINESMATENTTVSTKEATFTEEAELLELEACGSEALVSSVLQSVESVLGSADSVTINFLEVVLVWDVGGGWCLVILNVLYVLLVDVSVLNLGWWLVGWAHFNLTFLK